MPRKKPTEAPSKGTQRQAMQRFNMFLTDPQASALKEHSRRTGLTVSEIVRRAIDDFLGQDKADRP